MLNFKELEKQYQENRNLSETVRRLRIDPLTGKTLMGSRMVYEDGRFRQSGSSYLSIAGSTPRSSRSTKSIRLSASKIRHNQTAGDKLADLTCSRPLSKTSILSKAESRGSLKKQQALGIEEHKATVCRPSAKRLRLTSTRTHTSFQGNSWYDKDLSKMSAEDKCSGKSTSRNREVSTRDGKNTGPRILFPSKLKKFEKAY